jgi:hypothetical protein
MYTEIKFVNSFNLDPLFSPVSNLIYFKYVDLDIKYADRWTNVPSALIVYFMQFMQGTYKHLHDQMKNNYSAILTSIG